MLQTWTQTWSEFALRLLSQRFHWQPLWTVMACHRSWCADVKLALSLSERGWASDRSRSLLLPASCVARCRLLPSGMACY